MKKLITFATIAVLALGGTLAGAAAPATATEQYVCTPSEAYTEVITPEVPATPGTPAVEAVYETVVIEAAGWQRYSWTGGPWTSETPPAFPSEAWQPNVKGDPHGIGVQGAYFVSHGNSGNGDWFYLEATPEVTELVEVSPYVPAVPGTPAIPAVTEDHPAVVCPPTEEEPPTEEPPVVVPPVVTPPVVTPPVVAPPVVAPPALATPVTPVTERSVLAETGSDTDYAPLGIVVILLALGGAALFAANQLRKR